MLWHKTVHEKVETIVMSITAKALGKKIRKAREGIRLTQSEFAIKVGISAQSISAFESGRIRPQRKYLEKIAQLVKLPVAYFTGNQIEEALSRLDAVSTELTALREMLREAAGTDDGDDG
jgi:transcriptional regulator with XRE-family HTH domain